MRLPYTYFVALRYMKSKKKKGISFNTFVSIGGVLVGVMTLLVVLSVMGGFQEDLQKKIIGVSSHVIILSPDGAMEDYGQIMDSLKKEKHVVSASPFVLGQAMLSYDRSAQGVYIRGIDPAHEKNVTEIAKHMKEGSLADLEPKAGGPPGIILGSDLAGHLGVMPGDKIKVLSPTGDIGPLGMIPKMKEFRVAGIFEVGMFEYDSNLALTAIPPLQEFFGMGDRITGIEIKLDDIYKAPEVRRDLQRKFGYSYVVKDWIEMNRNLFAALKLEKMTMFVILTLIILVASFNIVSTLMMNVIEKQREIAILKAMGATNRGIMSIFMIQGLLIGLVGTILGVAGGFALSYALNAFQIIKLPSDVYYLSHLPARMNPRDFILVASAAIAISFSATIYPALQAAKLNPIESIRYE